MNFSNEDKILLMSGKTPVKSKILLYNDDNTLLYTFDEQTSIMEWNYEDYRFVPNNGFIGQFVERLLDGKLADVPNNISLDDKEVELQLGVVNGNNTDYYSYGRFVITSVGNTDTTGTYTFEAADYTKKFNKKYEDNITYPCTSMELLYNVSNQVGVEVFANGDAICYNINKDDILETGDYSFEYNNKYYNFTLNNDLKFRDSIMLIFNKNKIVATKINNNNKPVTYDISYIESDTQDGELLTGNVVPYCDFINNNFVIDGNQFINNESCRDVIKSIAGISFNWARINYQNKLCLDFEVLDEDDTDELNNIDTDKYKTSKITADTLKPINKVLIGMSNIEGENVFRTSEDYTEETESSLYIYDNPLMYSQLLRQIVISNCDVIFGLTYTPCEIDTIGLPWLEGNEFIEVSNLDGEVYYTYPLDRTIKYNGVIGGIIKSDAWSVIKQKYEYNSDTLNTLKRTEFIVNKDTGEIQLISSYVSEQGEKVSEIEEDIDTIKSQIQDIPVITTENEGTGELRLYNLAKTRLINLKVHPTDKDILGLFASTQLKAKQGLKTLSRGITFDNDTFDDLYYLIPKNLYFLDDIYDEFIYDGAEQRMYIIHRIGIENDEKYELEEEVIEELEFFDLILDEGDYTIFMGTYPTAYIYVKAMIRNDYTTTFATEIELKSSIEETTKYIMGIVSEKVDESEINTLYNQTANAIGLSVQQLKDGEQINGATIITQINDDGSSVQIEGDKISLAGKELDLTSDNINIDSTNFKVDKNGNMECNNANINGDLVSSKGLYTNLQYVGTFFGWDAEGYDMGRTSWFMGYGYSTNQDTGNHDVHESFPIARVYIPTDFIVDKAYITIKHNTVNWHPVSGDDVEGNAQKVKAYTFSGFDSSVYGVYESEYAQSTNLQETLISGNPMGANGKTFTSDDNNKVYTSNDISSAFNGSGIYFIGVKSSETKPSGGSWSTDETSNLGPKTGYASMVVNVYGWLKLR